jgi:8-oxo-dGTP diphosphatase
MEPNHASHLYYNMKSFNDMTMNSQTAVVVGLLRDASGRYLVCQRPATGRYPLKWEFPGGKVEPGEDSETALRRELHEELGVEADIGELIFIHLARYADGGTFTVEFYLIESWRGEIDGEAFADQRWLALDQLATVDLLEGSRPVCSVLETLHSDSK